MPENMNQEDLSAVMSAYLTAALDANLVRRFGSDTNMGRSFRRQAEQLVYRAISIDPVSKLSGKTVGDVSAADFFTRRARTRTIADAFPPGSGAKEREFDDLLKEKGLNPDTSVVVNVEKASSADLQFSGMSVENAEERREKHRQEMDELQRAIDSAKDGEERRLAEIARNVASQFNPDNITHVECVSVTRIVQDALSAVGIKPEQIMQFKLVYPDVPAQSCIREVPKHGYVIDLSDRDLVVRIKAETAKLTAQANEKDAAEPQGGHAEDVTTRRAADTGEGRRQVGK